MTARRRQINIDHLIEQAWTHRDNQDIEALLPVMEKLWLALGGRPETPPALSPSLARNWIEALLLQSSLERVYRNEVASRRWLEEARRVSTEFRLTPSFSMTFQTAIAFHLQGDLAGALERFVLAATLARTARQKGFALLNSLISLIHLGLPHDRTRKELHRHLERNPSRRGSDPLRGVRQQFDVIQLRKAWAAADWKAFDLETSQVHTIGAQGAFLRLYASEHPLLPNPPLLPRSLREVWSTENAFAFQQSYRQRTLQGVHHPSQDSTPRISDFADRLHLWTWRWLRAGAPAEFEKLATLLSSASGLLDSAGRTAEDESLLTNALKWISLKDPAVETLIADLKRSTALSSSPPDFQLAERELAEACQALKRGDVATARAIASAVANLKAVRNSRLSDIVTFVLESERSTPLQCKLAALTTSQASTSGLRVDPAGAAVHVLAQGRRIGSEPLSRAFTLLHARGNVSCEGFVEFCFGLPRFDSAIHLPKIFNLLSRMREIAPPGLRVGVKSGRVFAEGSWAEIEFASSAAFTPGVFQIHAERERSAPLWALLEGRTLLKRADLERLTGKSRASAHRLIQGWVSEGILVTRGAGRGARYEVRLPRAKKESSNAVP